MFSRDLRFRRTLAPFTTHHFSGSNTSETCCSNDESCNNLRHPFGSVKKGGLPKIDRPPAAAVAGSCTTAAAAAAAAAAAVLQPRQLLRALPFLPPHQIGVSLQQLGRHRRRLPQHFWLAAAETLLREEQPAAATAAAALEHTYISHLGKPQQIQQQQQQQLLLQAPPSRCNANCSSKSNSGGSLLSQLQPEHCSTISNAFAAAGRPHPRLFAALNERFAVAAAAAATAAAAANGASAAAAHSSGVRAGGGAAASAAMAAEAAAAEAARLHPRHVCVHFNALGNLRMREAALHFIQVLDSSSSNSGGVWPSIIASSSGCDLSMLFSALAKLHIHPGMLLQRMLQRLRQLLLQQVLQYPRHHEGQQQREQKKQMEQQVQQKQQQQHALDGRSAANIWAAMAELQSSVQQQQLLVLLLLLSDVLRAHILAGGLTALEVALVANAAPKFTQQQQQVGLLQQQQHFHQLLHAIERHVREFGRLYTSQGLTLVLHSFARLQQPSPLLFAAASPLLLQLLPSFKAQCFAAAALAYSSSTCCLPQQQVRALLLRFCNELEARAAIAAAAAAAEPLPGFAAQQVCGILGALAHAGCCTAGAFEALCCQLVLLQQKKMLLPRDAAEAAAAMAALQLLHAPLLRDLVSAAAAAAANYSPQNITKLLCAVAHFAGNGSGRTNSAATAVGNGNAASTIWREAGTRLAFAAAAAATGTAPSAVAAAAAHLPEEWQPPAAAAAHVQAEWDADAACRFLQGCFMLQLDAPNITEWAWRVAFHSSKPPTLSAVASALSFFAKSQNPLQHHETLAVIRAAIAAADFDLKAAATAAAATSRLTAALGNTSVIAAALVRLSVNSSNPHILQLLLFSRAGPMLQQQQQILQQQQQRTQQQQHQRCAGMQSLALLVLSWGAASIHVSRHCYTAAAAAADIRFLTPIVFLLQRQQQQHQQQDTPRDSSKAAARQLLLGVACWWHAHAAAAVAATVPIQLLRLALQIVRITEAVCKPSLVATHQQEPHEQQREDRQEQQFVQQQNDVCDIRATDEETSEMHVQVSATLASTLAKQRRQQQQQQERFPHWQLLVEHQVGVYRIDLLLLAKHQTSTQLASSWLVAG
ncbi:hypothetical protein, conserved [Eimeria maxima]|uniref:RAP domain-containing protein n=1 Tax=Eimeria maxima TaxID=5804 RepID=U6M3G7_EIMMA|nr:hypothetical protein, conserved [Eimeria maxima]CDJ56240.1 hypothetical protein, conserved [Eimeria maxima]